MKTIKVNNCLEVPNNFTGIVEYLYGTKEWFKEGKLHREDGPAIEHENGLKEWWVEDILHRTDGPAVEYPNGSKEWWIEGKQIPTEINITNKLYLGKEKGKYNLEWLRFLVEEGIEEYPIIPGIEYKITKNYSLDSFLESHK
jgi:hypothetical protein